MGSTKVKTVDMSEGLESEDKAAAKVSKKVTKAAKEQAKEQVKAVKTKKARARSKFYTALRSKVDRTKTYPLDQAIALVKQLTRKKHPTITADINYTEASSSFEVKLPHSTGKQVKVAIADAKLITQIVKGKIDFDILLASPDIMKDLAKHAKVLGPRGLMPNPKNKTITTNPQKRKKELEGGKLQIRTEKKAPIFHVQIGSASQPDQELIENLEALTKTLGRPKIKRLTLSSTMSPGVKVEIPQAESE